MNEAVFEAREWGSGEDDLISVCIDLAENTRIDSWNPNPSSVHPLPPCHTLYMKSFRLYNSPLEAQGITLPL